MLFESLLIDIRHLLPSYRLRKRKNDLRAQLLQRRRILDKAIVAQCSQEVINKIIELPEFRSAHTIMMYYPIQNEIDLRGLFAYCQGRTILLPVTHRKSLEMREWTGEEKMHHGKYGIPEPHTNTYKGSVDLILVPGVGFDKNNYRLGRGKGYYDRFLKRFKHTPKIGVGYAFQSVDEIPYARHDIKMDKVIFAESK